MKPTYATEVDKIKALAELDGLKELHWLSGKLHHGRDYCGCGQSVPDYLESYDAIIPLIQKLWRENKLSLSEIDKMFLQINDCKPEELSNAALIATGRMTL